MEVIPVVLDLLRRRTGGVSSCLSIPNFGGLLGPVAVAFFCIPSRGARRPSSFPPLLHSKVPPSTSMLSLMGRPLSSLPDCRLTGCCSWGVSIPSSSSSRDGGAWSLLSVLLLPSTFSRSPTVTFVDSSTRSSSVAGTASTPLWPISSFWGVGALSGACSVCPHIFGCLDSNFEDFAVPVSKVLLPLGRCQYCLHPVWVPEFYVNVFPNPSICIITSSCYCKCSVS